MINIFLGILLALMLLACCTFPGLAFIRYLPWSPLEKLCTVFAISYFAIYLAGFTLFALNTGPTPYFVASGIFILCGFAGLQQIRLFFQNRQTRTVLFLFALILAWDFLHLSIMRYFGGGNWAGDWHEHYDRTRYFLHQLPDDFLYLGLYLLPARPPMMNIMAAFFGRQVGLNFETYSLTFLFLNAFTFIPCCLLLRQIGPRGRLFSLSAQVLAILFMLNPSILENAAITTTKPFAAAFAIMGTTFYLRALRRNDSLRRIAAFCFFAEGILIHYSVMPYAVAAGLHYLFQWRPTKQNWLQLSWIFLLPASLLFTWWGWSSWRFGWRLTFGSNTTAQSVAGWSLTENIHKIFVDLFSSFVPHPFYYFPPASFWKNLNFTNVRDYYFMMSQTTLPMMMGALAWIIVTNALWRHIRYQDSASAQIRGFWLFFIPTTIFLCMAAQPSEEMFGLAQVSMQGLAIMGVTLVAASFSRISRFLLPVLFTSLIVDYLLGILLHFYRQTYPYSYSEDEIKRLNGYWFWGDQFAGISTYLLFASALIAICALIRLAMLRFILNPVKTKGNFSAPSSTVLQMKATG